MSTIPYGPNGEYRIGTIGWEAPQKLSQLPDSIVPTYGLWAGPGWAPGKEGQEKRDSALF